MPPFLSKSLIEIPKSFQINDPIFVIKMVKKRISFENNKTLLIWHHDLIGYCQLIRTFYFAQKSGKQDYQIISELFQSWEFYSKSWIFFNSKMKAWSCKAGSRKYAPFTSLFYLTVIFCSNISRVNIDWIKRFRFNCFQP